MQCMRDFTFQDWKPHDSTQDLFKDAHLFQYVHFMNEADPISFYRSRMEEFPCLVWQTSTRELQKRI